MATKRSKRAKSGAQISAKPKRRQGGKGKPFEPGNPHRILPGTTLNPGGRPRRLSDAYLDWLNKTDTAGVTNADKIAEVVGGRALFADDKAYREIRQATEGDKVTMDRKPKTAAEMTDEELAAIAASDQADGGQRTS